jgi:Glycoside hydrolase family 44
MKVPVLFIGLILSLCITALAQQSPAIRFDVDAKQDVRPISRFIYGINQFHGVLDGMDGPYSNCTLSRLGGNRLTAYNWTNNGSNAGNDWHFQNDGYLVDGPMFQGVGDLPGGANIPIIQTAYDHHAAALLTIPINGYVAADKKTVNNVRDEPDFLNTQFRPEKPRKNAPFTLNPDPAGSAVYEDEFVNWVKTKYPYGQDDPQRPIFFSLDNEPDWWSHTHPEIHPKPVTYAELIEKNIAYAAAAKDVMDKALIFGPVNYGWEGYVRLQDAPDANDRDFQEVYLQSMAKAEETYHHRLLDVMDVHWYPEATGNGVRIINNPADETVPAVVAARLQAPRSLWDSTYTEQSWITQDQLHAPIRLIPRLMDKIEQNYPGTKLAITEYSYGAGDDISGGVAEADVLGIFGREGLFAAALWPDKNIPFIGGAFEMYRNFDANNGTFGDLSVQAKTNDIERTSIYASLDSQNPNRMVIVLINKTPQPLPADLEIHGTHAFAQARAYQLTAEGPHPRPAGTLAIAGGQSLNYTMPAYSVTTLQLNRGLTPP